MAFIYLDHDVARRVATFLHIEGHDIVIAHDLGIGDATDDKHLLQASRQSRAFVTDNEDDYILLHDAWHRWSKAWGVSENHSGILIVPQGRRNGFDWDAQRISAEINAFLQAGPALAGELYWRKDRGWLRRQAKGWIEHR